MFKRSLPTVYGSEDEALRAKKVLEGKGIDSRPELFSIVIQDPLPKALDYFEVKVSRSDYRRACSVLKLNPKLPGARGLCPKCKLAVVEVADPSWFVARWFAHFRGNTNIPGDPVVCEKCEFRWQSFNRPRW